MICVNKLTRARTAREEESWVDWNDLCTRMMSTKAFIERASMNAEFLQSRSCTVLLASFYVLLPSVRNDYDGLRFVEHDGAYDASSDLSFEEYLDGIAKEHDR